MVAALQGSDLAGLRIRTPATTSAQGKEGAGPMFSTIQSRIASIAASIAASIFVVAVIAFPVVEKAAGLVA